MEASNSMQMMVPMNTFIKSGGVKTLLHNATYVTVTPVELDPRNEDNYFVDIRFRFSSKSGRPYFSKTECGIDGAFTPRKLVSKLSDEPGTTQATVVARQYMETVSECHENPEGEAVYIPDACWIARTKAVSSILEQEGTEQAEEEGRHLTNVSNVRGVVCAVQPNEDGAEPDMDREFCFDSPAAPATVAINGPVDEATSNHPEFTDSDAAKEPALNQFRDHGAAHSSRNGTDGLQQSKLDSAKAFRQMQKKSRDKFDDPELLLIQPNPVQQPRKLKKSVKDPARALIQPTPIRPSYNPPTNFEGVEAHPSQDPHLHRVILEEGCATPSRDGAQVRTDRNVESEDSVARNLFRRTSDLAKKVIRKLSSNDKRAAHDANGEGNGDPNNINRVAKRRSWFRRSTLREDIGRRPGM